MNFFGDVFQEAYKRHELNESDEPKLTDEMIWCELFTCYVQQGCLPYEAAKTADNGLNEFKSRFRKD